MAFNLKPKEEKFFQTLAEHSMLVREATELLHSAIADRSQVPELMKKINETERIADEIVDRILAKLHKTFIAPMDREDIFTLAKKLDDIIDCIKAAIERMDLYNIDEPSERIREMSELILKCGKQVEKAIFSLQDMKKERLRLQARCERIIDLEARGDELYRQEMGKLFRECTDAIDIIKWKEILVNLEEVLDLSEDVATSLKRVVIKYA
jgi:predicted phosphate transport protein (TIGR00153 family)